MAGRHWLIAVVRAVQLTSQFITFEKSTGRMKGQRDDAGMSFDSVMPPRSPLMRHASGEPRGDKSSGEERCNERHSIDEPDKRPHDCVDEDAFARLSRRKFCIDEHGRDVYAGEEEAAHNASGERGGEWMLEPEHTPELARIFAIPQQQQPRAVAVGAPARVSIISDDDAPDDVSAAGRRRTVGLARELIAPSTSTAASLSESEPSATVVETVESPPPPLAFAPAKPARATV